MFNVKFRVNENFEVSIKALENMMFAELSYNLSQMIGLKEEHKASYTFNAKNIKADSMRNLKEIGIEKILLFMLKLKYLLITNLKTPKNQKLQ